MTMHEPRARTFGYGGVRIECTCGTWHSDDGTLFSEHTQAVIEKAQEQAWFEGYSQRPLYDGQNLANPPVENPYRSKQ